MSQPSLPRLLLASTSRYRAQLLARLQLPFECVAPAVDENLLPAENPAERAQRLALAKAGAVAQRFPGCAVIGSDQVAALGEQILRKPGSVEAQRDQLRACAGSAVDFHTALCLIGGNGQVLQHLDHTRCLLRRLDDAEIDRYVNAEPAADCAGGFKVEGLGISLFESVHNQDPSALVGLPLIALGRFLRQCGWTLP